MAINQVRHADSGGHTVITAVPADGETVTPGMPVQASLVDGEVRVKQIESSQFYGVVGRKTVEDDTNEYDDTDIVPVYVQGVVRIDSAYASPDKIGEVLWAASDGSLIPMSSGDEPDGMVGKYVDSDDDYEVVNLR